MTTASSLLESTRDGNGDVNVDSLSRPSIVPSRNSSVIGSGEYAVETCQYQRKISLRQ